MNELEQAQADAWKAIAGMATRAEAFFLQAEKAAKNLERITQAAADKMDQEAAEEKRRGGR